MTQSRAEHIAITGMKRRQENLGRLPTDYITAVRNAGGAPVVVSTFDLYPDEQPPPDVDVRAGLDPLDPSTLDGAVGLVLTGGGDVDPAFYGQKPHPRAYNITPRRDRFEFTLLDQALRKDIPVFAICRGMQVLNVHLGGTLDQHLMDQPQRLEHDRDRPRGEPAHNVRLKERSTLARILDRARAGVNSHHHQGLDTVANSLEEVGWAEDGVLEAVVSRESAWVVGVQWHPESMAPVDLVQRALFESFVDATQRYAEAGSAASASPR